MKKLECLFLAVAHMIAGVLAVISAVCALICLPDSFISETAGNHMTACLILVVANVISALIFLHYHKEAIIDIQGYYIPWSERKNRF